MILDFTMQAHNDVDYSEPLTQLIPEDWVDNWWAHYAETKMTLCQLHQMKRLYESTLRAYANLNHSWKWTDKALKQQHNRWSRRKHITQ